MTDSTKNAKLDELVLEIQKTAVQILENPKSINDKAAPGILNEDVNNYFKVD